MDSDPGDKAYKVTDGQGLYVFVKPDGSRYRRMDYRYERKRKTLSFGVYPQVSLKAARTKRDRAHELLDKGIDPAVYRQITRGVATISSGDSFGAVANEWLSKIEAEGRSPATMEKTRWLLSFAEPLIGNRPIRLITAPDLLTVLRSIEVRRRYETARRLRSTCGSILRYAIATGRADHDVSVFLQGALVTPKVRHRAAIVEPKRVGALLRAIDGYEGQPTLEAALRIAPHVFVRPGELRQA